MLGLSFAAHVLHMIIALTASYNWQSDNTSPTTTLLANVRQPDTGLYHKPCGFTGNLVGTAISQLATTLVDPAYLTRVVASIQ